MSGLTCDRVIQRNHHRLCFRHQTQTQLQYHIEQRAGSPAAQREQFIVGRPALKLSLLRANRTADGAASQTHQQRERKANGASMCPVIGKTWTPLLNQSQKLGQQLHYESSRSGIRANVFGAVRMKRSCRATRLLMADTTDSRSNSTPNRLCTAARISVMWSGRASR